MRTVLCLAVLFLLLFFILISLLGAPAWIGRAIAVSIFALCATIGIFWFGLSPKSKMIRAGGKFNEPQFDEVRPQIEKGIRILVVAFGVFFAFYVSVPVGSDLIHLVGGEKPIRITAVAKDNSIPLFGLWFVHQTVRFQRGGESYSLFFSWEHVRIGASYEFVVLPRSREILDFHESGDLRR
ncbi:MAG TPA: hypothetical protein VNY24_14490 [Candidatus Acidoferrales bacterium]|jgi:hypothetical protein|nr:hypothetical protein [Candidatus Acidoferrales bacterium]